MQLSTSMFMKQKNVVTKTTGKVLNAKTTYYVYEATNILFTFENRGALKQTENRYCNTTIVR